MKNKPRLVVDTNIFIDAWFDDIEECNQVLELMATNKVKLACSQDMIGELMYMVKKFAIKFLSSNKIRLTLLYKVSNLFFKSTSVDTRGIECPKIKDRYDKMFVKCAIASHSDYLISNDFKSGMHNLKEIKVLSAKDFMDKYNNQDKENAKGEVAVTKKSIEESNDKDEK